MSEQKVTCRTRPESRAEKGTINRGHRSCKQASSSRRGHLPICPPRWLSPKCLGIPAAEADGRLPSLKLRPRPGGGLSTGSEGSRRLSLLSLQSLLSLRSPLLPKKESEPDVERRRFPLQRERFIVNSSLLFSDSHGSCVLPFWRKPALWQVWPSSSRQGLQTRASPPNRNHRVLGNDSNLRTIESWGRSGSRWCLRPPASVVDECETSRVGPRVKEAGKNTLRV